MIVNFAVADVEGQKREQGLFDVIVKWIVDFTFFHESLQVWVW